MRNLIRIIISFKHLLSAFGIGIIATLLYSCYGEINVSCEFLGAGCYDSDSVNIWFFHSSEVNRPAKGITALPDGGIPEVLFKKVTLCQFNILKKSLVTIMDYGALPWSGSRWKFYLTIRNDTAAFRIEPVSGWENEMKWGLDSVYYNKYKNWYVYSIRSGELTMTESEIPVPIDPEYVSISEMKTLTRELTYQDRGIDLKVISTSRKRERIKELSQLKGNRAYRDALIETLADDLTDDEINRIISEINEYLNSLDSYDRLLKKESAEKTIEKLEILLK